MEHLLTLYNRAYAGNQPINPPNRMGSLRWLQGSFVDSIQLDIVGFLAILGEGSIAANLQVSTLSMLIFIPRLVPAPQVFFRPNRDSKLDPSPGNVTGVYSGNDKDFVNYLGHTVLDAEDMPDYSVRCVQIEKTDAKAKVKARTRGPLSLLAFLGCAESIAIFGVSIYNRDGMALLAVILLSSLSSLAGLANWWYLELPKRRKMAVKPAGKNTAGQSIKMEPPPGDVVVRYPKGSFLVVQCSEDVARELYFAPENVYYLIESPWMYRLMSLCGTLMLMLGIVALGNADNPQQILFAGCYMALNAAYWLVAALPARLHWDLSMYNLSVQKIKSIPQLEDDEDFTDKEAAEKGSQELKRRIREKRENQKLKAMAERTYTDLNPNFTWAMWKTIVATESVDWVKKNDALPETVVWNEWLCDALNEAKKRTIYYTYPTEDEHSPPYPVKTFRVPDWDPQAHFYSLLNKHQGMADFQQVRRNEKIELNPGPPSKRNTQTSFSEKETRSPFSPAQSLLSPAVKQDGQIGDIGIPVSTARQPTS